jgi:hypothetical protein
MFKENVPREYLKRTFKREHSKESTKENIKRERPAGTFQENSWSCGGVRGE